jgi:hypothetical protein
VSSEAESEPSMLLIESLLKAAEKIESELSDDFTDWKKKSDLFLLAIKQLETRQIENTESAKLFGVPILEAKLRDAAETALRNCAHFAESFEERVVFVDGANKIRNVTWF